MISLFFIYIDVVISRYRFRIIINSSFSFYRRDNCYIIRVSLFLYNYFSCNYLLYNYFSCNHLSCNYLSCNISCNILSSYNSDVYSFKKLINSNYILLFNHLIYRDRYFLLSLSQYILEFKRFALDKVFKNLHMSAFLVFRF